MVTRHVRVALRCDSHPFDVTGQCSFGAMQGPSKKMTALPPASSLTVFNAAVRAESVDLVFA